MKDNNLKSQEFINELPVHIARPIHKLLETDSFFTKLYLMSDSLMGILRINGSFLKEIYLQKDNQNEELNTIFETLELKESHGLWSSMTAKVSTLLDEDTELFVLGEIMTLFGVKSKTGRTRKIKRLTINNTYTDWKGQTQTVKIDNTPLELLINFRNKYLGHGTVFSEEESKKIYELYEPIFVEMLNQCKFLKKLSILDQKTKSNINGYENSCSGKLTIITEEGNLYQIDNVAQLSYKEFKPLNTKNQSPDQFIEKEDQKIIDTYPYFLAHPYHRALTETDPFKRIHLLKETFLNYLKYLGLVTASEYFSSDLKIKDINKNFKQFLFRPQFGFWNAFMRETVKALKENKHEWFVRELPDYYKKIENEKKAKKYNDHTGIGALINFRNHYLGHGMVPAREKCEALWVENFAILKELLVEMEFCKNYSIVSKDRNITLRLMGNEITQVNLKTKLQSNVAMLNEKNEQISVVPFFVLPGEYFDSEISENAKLMVYEQNTGKRMVFFSPE
ncbi:MAG: hypothetical protein P8O83_04210, partial [Flavobacteriaceae bacterium]|nr:hypothetical protein [Flavobacteriaceae bacterium]